MTRLLLLSYQTYLISQRWKVTMIQQQQQRRLWQNLSFQKIVRLIRLVTDNHFGDSFGFHKKMFSVCLLKLLQDQPKLEPTSSIKKCCPLHQHYKYDYGKRSCANSTSDFRFSAIQAKFYENCIEDEELNITISVVVENNCRKYGFISTHFR